MPKQVCRDDDLRISGLQLPEDAATVPGLDAARSLAVSQTTTYRWLLAEDLAAYSRAGIGGIGLYRPKLEEVEEDVAIDMVRSSGLTVSSLSWVGGFTGSDGASQAEALFDAGEAVRFAAAVGAGTVAVVSGGVGSHIAKHARRLLNDALRTLCDEAAELDVRLALHPFSSGTAGGRTVLSNLDEALAAVAAAGRPNLGLVFDVTELGRESNLLRRIPEVAGLVHVVKLSDRRTRHDHTRRAGDGAVTTRSVVRAFLDAGYEGPFEFDLWSEAVRRPAEYADLLDSCRSRFESLGPFLNIENIEA